MQKSKPSSLRTTLLVAALTLAVGFATAQTSSPVISQQPILNPKIAAAAKPYQDNPARAPESLALFEALNTPASDDADVLSWLGFLYLQTGSPDKAIPPLEQAAGKRPDNIEIQINLGNAYFSSRTPQYDKALASYTKVSAVRSQMYEPHYNTGVIYLQRRQYPAAIAELKKAETLKPEDPFIKNNLGVAYERSKDEDDAATKFRQASDLRQGKDKTFARNAGLAILKLNPTQDRAPYAKQAKPYLENADVNDPAVALALANISVTSEPDLPRARALCDVAEKNLANPKYSNDLETYWFNIGAIRRSAGDNSGAVRAYKQALAIKPGDVDALKNLGSLQFERKEYKDAETTFDKLTGLLPESFEAWQSLASSATLANDTEKAITAYREAVRLGGNAKQKETKDLVDLRLGLADELYKKGDNPGATAEYRQVLAMDKNNAKALNGIGLIYLHDKKYVQAEAVLRSAIASDNTFAAAYNNLGIALDNLLRRKEAIAMIEKAHRLAMNDPSITENLRRLKNP